MGSQVSDINNADSLGEEQFVKLEEEDEAEPAIEQRIEKTDLRSYLETRNEHVSRQSLALTLEMTDETCREAEM